MEAEELKATGLISLQAATSRIILKWRIVKMYVVIYSIFISNFTMGHSDLDR
jgi:hypothetical protein